MGYIGDKPNSIFKLELDGNKLSQKYKIKPFTYVSKTNIRFTEESEEQIKTNKIKNAISYIKKVIIISERINNLLDSGWFESDGGYFKSNRITLPELLKIIINKLNEKGLEVWVQKGHIIKKDDEYINFILNKDIKQVNHGYAYYLRGYVKGEKHGMNVHLDKVLPVDNKNNELDNLVIGYDYDNLYLLKDKNNINIDKIEIPKDFKLYLFDFTYELNDVIEETDDNIYLRTSKLQNIEIIKYNQFNESIRHLLKPKSEKDILKSLQGNDVEKFIKFIKQGMNVPNKIKNKIDYYFSVLKVYRKIDKKEQTIPFTEEEKIKIDNAIHNSKNKDNYYIYDKINNDNDYISLYINDNDMDMEFYVRKLNEYILIYEYNIEYDKELRNLIMCVTINELLDYLDINILANKRN